MVVDEEPADGEAPSGNNLKARFETLGGSGPLLIAPKHIGNVISTIYVS